jgi:branched-chain amino acid transport system substrate-binding protein
LSFEAFVNTSPVAFRNLSQWEPLRTSQRRDNLVTQSALGDPGPVGLERVRDFSGFSFTIELRRRVLSTLSKTLLPLGLMALILYASLYFPSSMATPKVTAVVTSAMSGTVLLPTINSQLGNIGYVIHVEYAFYAFFSCACCAWWRPSWSRIIGWLDGPPRSLSWSEYPVIRI